MKRLLTLSGLALFALLLIGAVTVGPNSGSNSGGPGAGGSINSQSGAGNLTTITNLTVMNSITTTGGTYTSWQLIPIAGQTNLVLQSMNTNQSLTMWALGSNGTPVFYYGEDFTTLTGVPGAGVASTNYIDFSTNAVQYLTNLTVGAVYLHSTNRLNIVGARSLVCYLMSSTNVTYNLNTSWRTIGTNNVFYVSSNKFTMLTLLMNGAGETNITCSYGIQF